MRSVLIFLAVAPLFGQTAALTPSPRQQFFDNNGTPLNGGMLYTYAAGTSSQQSTFTDSSGSTANPDPVVLDSGGRASVWLGGGLAYKMVLQNSTGVTIWSVDNVSAAPLDMMTTDTAQTIFGAKNFQGTQTFTNLVVNGTCSGAGCPGGGSGGGSGSGLLNGISISQLGSGATGTGGYIHLTPITYPDSSCVDVYGNPVNQPVRLAGLPAFGPTDAVLWVSESPSPGVNPPGCEPAIPYNDLYGLNLNTYFLARGGLATDNASYNSVQSLTGGMYAYSFTSQYYVNVGHSSGTPPLTQYDSWNPGAIYWDDVQTCLEVYNGSAWSCLGSGGGGGGGGGSVNVVWTKSTTTPNGSATAFSFPNQPLWVSWNGVNQFQGVGYTMTGTGPYVVTFEAVGGGTLTPATGDDIREASVGSGGGGGGTPGGLNTNVQFNNSGALGGSGNLTWDNTNQILTITAKNSLSYGLYVATGYAVSDVGFTACANGFAGCTYGTATAYNSIQAPGGGMWALSFTAVNYIQSGNHSGAPTATTSDAFHAGALYWDNGTHSEMVYTDSGSWTPLSSGSGALVPGGSNGNVQYNQSAALAGSANFTWNNASQYLQITAPDSAHAGLSIAKGFAVADNGFLATQSTATSFNVIQAPGGGMEALSFSAVNYVQTGNRAGAPTPTLNDMFHAGAMYWDLNAHAEMVYNDSGTWTALGAGGGSAAGPSSAVQYNSGTGFAGSSNFTWNNASQVLVVAGIAHTPGIAVTGGYVQSDGGFSVLTEASYNSVQAAYSGGVLIGGMAARSFTATAYVQVGSGASAPSPTLNDAFHPGALWYNTSAGVNCLEVYSGSSWTCVQTNSGSSGVLSLNGLSGGLSITSSFMTVLPSGNSVSLSLPQQIGTGAAVTFASVNSFSLTASGPVTGGTYAIGGNQVISGIGSFTSPAGGGNLAFSTSGNCAGLATPCFLASGQGYLFAAGTIQTNTAFTACATGYAGCSSGTATAYNSIQAPGGGMWALSFTAVNYVQTGSHFGAPPPTTSDSFHAGATYWDSSQHAQMVYTDSGTWAPVVNNLGQWIGNGVNVGGYGVSAGGYNVAGGYIGQTWNVSIPGLSIPGTGCSAGLIFRGGVLVSCF